MKKMTKVISLALALVMCLALCACGKKEASYKMLDEKVSTEQYAIGFKKGNTELRDAVQAALFQLYKDGKVEEIAKKYSDYNLDAMLCLDKQTETTFDAAQASDEFKARTTFTVGFDAEYPPYGYMGEDGEYTGFDLDLAQAVCDIYNWELVKTPIDWDTHFHDRPRILGVPLTGGAGEYRLRAPLRTIGQAGLAQTMICEPPKAFSVRILSPIELARAAPLGGLTGWQPARPVVQWTVTR